MQQPPAVPPPTTNDPLNLFNDKPAVNPNQDKADAAAERVRNITTCQETYLQDVRTNWPRLCAQQGAPAGCLPNGYVPIPDAMKNCLDLYPVSP